MDCYNYIENAKNPFQEILTYAKSANNIENDAYFAKRIITILIGVFFIIDLSLTFLIYFRIIKTKT